MAQFYNDDCFNVFPKLGEKSIDLVVVDLPYGQTACKWDVVIDLEKMWKELKRICKRKALYVFFTTTRYGVQLINSKPRWFKYDLVWEKSKKVGFLSANKMPLRKHEMIYVFGDNAESKKSYNPQKTEGKPYKTSSGKRIGLTYYRKNENDEHKVEEVINKGDRHPDSILKIEPTHEMVYVFGNNGGGPKTYNPQKTEGHKHYKGINRDKDISNKQYGKTVDTLKDNKGDRHPDSILKIEPTHEMMYVFGDNSGGVKTYNPQKVEGKAYKMTRGTQTDLYRKTDTVITTNNGDRHPDSILKIEPTHEMVYVFGDNSGGPKTYNPQKVEGKPYIHNGRNDAHLYGIEKHTPTINKGERHPDSILKIKPKHEPYEEGVPNYRTDVDNKGFFHPSSILQFKNPHKPIHRTQKPTELYEWLIKSYSNENETVLDFCAGSFTCAIACKNTNRKSICIEMDEEIYKIGKKRYDLINN